MLAGLGAVGVAQTPAPAPVQGHTATREGNEWDWRDHQPNEAGVLAKERAAGVAPSASETAATAATENRIERQLLRDDKQR